MGRQGDGETRREGKTYCSSPRLLVSHLLVLVLPENPSGLHIIEWRWILHLANHASERPRR